jgi:hypothetical protein
MASLSGQPAARRARLADQSRSILGRKIDPLLNRIAMRSDIRATTSQVQALLGSLTRSMSLWARRLDAGLAQHCALQHRRRSVHEPSLRNWLQYAPEMMGFPR